MPYRSQAQAGYFHTHKAQLERQGVDVAEWDRATRGKHLPKRVKKKKKPSIKVNNHIRAFGEEENGKITINVKKHKGDKAEIADTVFHEQYHAKHPKATEKVTYKKTRQAMKEMSYAEKEKLAAKVRNKGVHYRQGALKRKFKMGRGNVEPGAFINKLNERKSQKPARKGRNLKKLAIMGLV